MHNYSTRRNCLLTKPSPGEKFSSRLLLVEGFYMKMNIWNKLFIIIHRYQIINLFHYIQLTEYYLFKSLSTNEKLEIND